MTRGPNKTTSSSSPASKPMSAQRKLFGIIVAALLMAYLGGYLLVVQPRLNPFLSWKGVPLSKYPYYRVEGPVVKTLFEPLVQLDRRAFPKRWFYEPPLEYQQRLQQSLKNIDLQKLHEAAKRQEAESEANR